MCLRSRISPASAPVLYLTAKFPGLNVTFERTKLIIRDEEWAGTSSSDVPAV